MKSFGKVIRSLIATVGIGLVAIFVAAIIAFTCVDFAGDTPSGWWYDWLAARAGIEKRVHPHGLRHTMA